MTATSAPATTCPPWCDGSHENVMDDGTPEHSQTRLVPGHPVHPVDVTLRWHAGQEGPAISVGGDAWVSLDQADALVDAIQDAVAEVHRHRFAAAMLALFGHSSRSRVERETTFFRLRGVRRGTSHVVKSVGMISPDGVAPELHARTELYAATWCGGMFDGDRIEILPAAEAPVCERCARSAL